MVYKLQIRNVLTRFAKDIHKKLHDMLGQDICDDISFLVKSNKVKLILLKILLMIQMSMLWNILRN